MFEGRAWVYLTPLRNDFTEENTGLLRELKKDDIKYHIYKIEPWIDKFGVRSIGQTTLSYGSLTYDEYGGLPYHEYVLVAENLSKSKRAYGWQSVGHVYFHWEDKDRKRSKCFYKLKSISFPELLEEVTEKDMLLHMKKWNKKYDNVMQSLKRERDADKFGI